MVTYFDSICQNIPTELRSNWGWVPWRYEGRPKRPGKQHIVPLNARTGRNKKARDMGAWGSIHAAIRTAKKHGCPGIGFMFPWDCFALEIDYCVDKETGEVDEVGQAIIDSIPSYVEYSLDGTGVHIICKGSFPREVSGQRYGRMGLFDRGCCLPITGNPFGEPKLLEDCTEAIVDIIEKYMKPTHLL